MNDWYPTKITYHGLDFEIQGSGTIVGNSKLWVPSMQGSGVLPMYPFGEPVNFPQHELDDLIVHHDDLEQTIVYHFAINVRFTYD